MGLEVWDVHLRHFTDSRSHQKPFCVSSALMRNNLAFALCVPFRPVYWESKYIFDEWWMVYLFMYTFTGCDWERLFGLFIFVFHLVCLVLSVFLLPSHFCSICSPCSSPCSCSGLVHDTFFSLALSFHFISFYLASHCWITMNLQWSMSLGCHTLMLINADTLKESNGIGEMCCVLNILTFCKQQKCRKVCDTPIPRIINTYY